jgi:hypothetical protein
MTVKDGFWSLLSHGELTVDRITVCFTKDQDQAAKNVERSRSGQK